jgi:hypothetical protein
VKIALFIAILDLTPCKTRATEARPAVTAAADVAAMQITSRIGVVTVPSSR